MNLQKRPQNITGGPKNINRGLHAYSKWLFFTLLKSNRCWWLRAYTKTQTTYGMLSNKGNRYRGLLQLLTNGQTLRNTKGW